jgi:RNA polymerase sigma-70 factor (family 1)
MQPKKFESCSDEMLLQSILKDDMNAFEEIYHRYWPRLYSMGYKRLKMREAAEELVQDIFSSLWINRHTTIVYSLSSYLLTSMKYKVINYMRHEMVKQSFIDQKTTWSSALDNSTEERVLLEDLQIALEREVNRLPVACQNVFRLSREENLTMKQVAHQLGISEKTVENQLGKAYKVLRTNLKHFTFLVTLILFV